MTENNVSDNNRSNIYRGTANGIIIGGLLGLVFGALYRFSTLYIPIVSSIFTTIPFNSAITGTIIGIVLGGIIGGLISFYIYNSESNTTNDTNFISNKHINDNYEGSLTLHKENLSISKNKVQKAEVTFHKEKIIEEKTITVPVIREELVVEKKTIDSKKGDNNNHHIQSIRIPISEEEIEVIKHPVDLEDVNIYKNKVEENVHIEENLKREELRLENEGNSTIIDNNNEKNS